MMSKKIISILTLICIVVSCFAIVPVSATELTLEAISKDTVYAAILAENAESTIDVATTQEEGYISVAITSDLLKKHENGADPAVEGYWAGFAVVAPEGATHYKYAFDTNGEAALGDAVALTNDDVVTADGKKGIAFYADAGSDSPKTHAKLQWFSDETTAMSLETSFVINLSGIVKEAEPTLETISKNTVYAAILAEDADSTINVTATQEEDYVGVAITSELLKSHENGAGTPGHWAGFAVTAPDGATHYKYAFDANGETPLSTAVALTNDDIVTADGKKGIAFYADAGSFDAKTHAKLQWLSDETTPISLETSFVMNLDGIILDGIPKVNTRISSLDKKSEEVYLNNVYHEGDVSVDFSKIKMEYFDGKEITVNPVFDVANVCDSNSDAEQRKASVYKEGSYSVNASTEDGIITIAMEDLAMHKNAEQVDGYWTGFKVTAPEGAKYLEYYKSFGSQSYGTIEFSEDDKDVSFYIDVVSGSGYKEISLLWLDENDVPLSPVADYYIDLKGVKLDTEITISEANVCDSFPGENAPAKVYETYSVENKEISNAYNEIIIKMTDLALHRNGNKVPGYWTGFKVKGPENAKYLRYNKNFGDSHWDTIELDETKEKSFYFDVLRMYEGYNNYVYIQFFDDEDRPITRYTCYEINWDGVQCKYPEPGTITKANVADFDGDNEKVYEEYDVVCDEYGDIVLTAKDLESHTNGNGDEGHWIGFAVKAPEGATHYTYWFGNSYSNNPIALEEGEDSVSFYVNASAPYAKEYLEIRWYCDVTDPESYPYTHAYDYNGYYIDITGVDLADDLNVDVTAANIVDKANTEVAPYEGTPSATVVDDVIKLKAEKLKAHKNGENELGAWVGAAISKPEGAVNVKYLFDEYAWWGGASYADASEILDEDGEKVSFYVDAFDPSVKKNIMIQWFDENDVAITNIKKYELDLTEVDYKVEDAVLAISKANIVDQANPEVEPFDGEYDAKLVNDTIKLSADFLNGHENGEGNYGSWIGFSAYVEGAKYLKYVFDNEHYMNDNAWYYATQIDVTEAVPFYVDAANYRYKNRVMLQWFDENGRALTNVNTYNIDIEKVALEDRFPVLYSNIELTGEDKRFYNLISANGFEGLTKDEYVNLVSTADYVYILTEATNGSAAIKVEGIDESNGGNVFYRNKDRSVTLVATPNSGYTFVGWYDRDGVKVSGNASYDVKLKACYDLVAKFNVTSYGGGTNIGGGGVAASTVAKPVASVLAGEVEKGTKVELTTKTKDAVIYFTVDGTTPTESSMLYSGGITINEDTTIKAIAVKGKSKSAVLTVKYTVEKEEDTSTEEPTTEEPSATNTPAFSDIANYSWASDAITALAEKGIIKGVSSTEFAPASDIKRADFMLLLVRMLGLNADVTSNFDDVSADKYYYEGIGIAKALGLTTGVGDNKFNPEASITRQDMFVLAYRILMMQKAELIDADESAISAFDDYSMIADYAKEGLASLVKNELVKGSYNKINPVGNATRAETAVFIYRLYTLFNN